MLVHHFGSKEGLIIAVMEKVRANFQSLFEAAAPRASKGEPTDIMLGFWQSITSSKNLPYLRLLFEVQILAIQNPKRYKRYLVDTSSSWQRLIESALPQGKLRVATATLNTAVIDGLILELLSTGDFRRTSNALKLFVAQFGNSAGKVHAIRARSRKVSLRR
jgi:AcrR family transcriptional regulator